MIIPRRQSYPSKSMKSLSLLIKYNRVKKANILKISTLLKAH